MPRGRPRACGLPAGSGVAKLGLQGQTDRYCIYWVWLLFCFIPDNRPPLPLTAGRPKWVLGQEGSAAPRPVSRDGGVAGESFGKKEEGLGGEGREPGGAAM